SCPAGRAAGTSTSSTTGFASCSGTSATYSPSQARAGTGSAWARIWTSQSIADCEVQIRDRLRGPAPRPRRPGAGTDLDLAVDRGLRALSHVRRCRPRPGGADAGEMGDGEIGARTDGDRVRGRIEAGDEARSAVRSGLLNAQALALSD